MAPYLPDFEDLLRVVELTGGFVLQPVEVPGPDLARALADWLSARGHPTLVSEPEDDAAWKEITGWLLEEAKPPPEGVVMVIGSRDPPEGVYLALRLVNERRDGIARRLACPLFWCGPARFLQLTRERAPDFWSVRAVERRLALVPAADRAAPRGSAPAEDLVEEARRQGDVVSTARLALQGAREALAAGRIDETLARLDAVPAGIEAVAPALHAETTLLRGEIQRRRGELDLARETLSSLLPWPRMLPPGEDLQRAGEEEARRHTEKKQRAPDEWQIACRAYLSFGQTLETRGDIVGADRAYRLAQDAAASAEDPALSTLAMIRLGVLHCADRPWEALSALQHGRALAEAQGDLALAAFATALLGSVEDRLYDRARARKQIEEARNLADRARGKPTVLLGGELEEALTAAEHALSDAGDKARVGSLASVRSTDAPPDPDKPIPPAAKGAVAPSRSRWFLWPVALFGALVGLTLGILSGRHGDPLPSPSYSSHDGGVEHAMSPSAHDADRWCFVDRDGHIACLPTERACEAAQKRLGTPESPCQQPRQPALDSLPE